MAADRRDINRLNISKGSRLRRASARESLSNSGRSADTRISHTDEAGMVLQARAAGGKYYSVPLFDLNNPNVDTPSIKAEGDNLALTGNKIAIKKDVTIGDNIKLGIDDGNLGAGKSTFSYGAQEVLQMYGIAGTFPDYYVHIGSKRDGIALKFGIDDDLKITGGGTLASSSNDAQIACTNNDAVLYIVLDDTGKMQVGGPSTFTTFDSATKSVGIGTSTFDSSSVENLYIGNGTAPSGTPSNAYALYTELGALKGKGGSGTTTTIGAADPHCQRCGRDFALEWENYESGYGKLSICVWCLTDSLPDCVIEKNPE
jgi:hypothetical protein